MRRLNNLVPKLTTIAVTTLLLCSLSSQTTATIIANATSGLSSPDEIIDFSGLAGGVSITNQFASQGVIFDGPFRAQSGCVTGIDGACSNSANGSLSSIYSIQFLQTVTEAALLLVTNPGTTTFTALLGGSIVESFAATTNNDGVNTDYFGFSGIIFDELRYTINAANSNFNLDNVQYAGASVPEPATLALLGLGLFGLGFNRRKRIGSSAEFVA